MRFVLLEGVLQLLVRADREKANAENDATQWAKACSDRDVVSMIMPVIESQDPDVLLLYYGAAFLLRIDDQENAKAWLEKALVLQPDFWLARLELFELSKDDQTLTPFFQGTAFLFHGACP